MAFMGMPKVNQCPNCNGIMYEGEEVKERPGYCLKCTFDFSLKRQTVDRSSEWKEHLAGFGRVVNNSSAPAKKGR